MSGQAVLLKARMTRFPVVDVRVSNSILWKVLKYYYDRGEAVVFIGSKNVKEEHIDKDKALYISD